jgi:hypothetical protein
MNSPARVAIWRCSILLTPRIGSYGWAGVWVEPVARTHHRSLLSQSEAFLIVSHSLIRSINCELARDPSFGIFVVLDTLLMKLLTKKNGT